METETVRASAARVTVTCMLVSVFTLMISSLSYADSIQKIQSANPQNVNTIGSSGIAFLGSANYISVVGVLVGSLAVVVAVITAIYALGLVFQYNTAKETLRRFEKEYDKRTSELGKVYVPPGELLDRAKETAKGLDAKITKEYRERFESARIMIERERSRVETSVDACRNEHKKEYERLISEITKIRAEMREIPSASDMIFNISERYTSPEILEENILRKVLNALIQANGFDTAQIKAITKELKVDVKGKWK